MTLYIMKWIYVDMENYLGFIDMWKKVNCKIRSVVWFYLYILNNIFKKYMYVCIYKCMFMCT